jgi:hypothetical protein
VKIVSRDEETSLELCQLNADFFVATIRSTGIHARGQVAAYMPDGLAELFVTIARDWRGWPDARTWRSLEGELEIRATFQKNGNVDFDVTLQYGAAAIWQVGTVIVVESGQLSALAEAAREFEDALRGAG